MEVEYIEIPNYITRENAHKAKEERKTTVDIITILTGIVIVSFIIGKIVNEYLSFYIA